VSHLPDSSTQLLRSGSPRRSFLCQAKYSVPQVSGPIRAHVILSLRPSEAEPEPEKLDKLILRPPIYSSLRRIQCRDPMSTDTSSCLLRMTARVIGVGPFEITTQLVGQGKYPQNILHITGRGNCVPGASSKPLSELRSAGDSTLDIAACCSFAGFFYR